MHQLKQISPQNTDQIETVALEVGALRGEVNEIKYHLGTLTNEFSHFKNIMNKRHQETGEKLDMIMDALAIER